MLIGKFLKIDFLITPNAEMDNEYSHSEHDDVDEGSYLVQTLGHVLRYSSESIWDSLAEANIAKNVNGAAFLEASKS